MLIISKILVILMIVNGFVFISIILIIRPIQILIIPLMVIILIILSILTDTIILIFLETYKFIENFTKKSLNYCNSLRIFLKIVIMLSYKYSLLLIIIDEFTKQSNNL